MSSQTPFEQLLPSHLSDEAAFILWECFRELTMICEGKYAHQINREYALRIMQDEVEFGEVQPVKDDRQIEIPF